MHRKFVLLVSSVSLLPWAVAAAADSKQVLSELSQALGADNLRSIEYSGAGHSFALGQAGTVDSPWPKFNDKTYTRVVSFEPWATSLQRVRTQGENPPRGGGGQPIVGEQNQTQTVAPGSAAAATLPDELALALPQAFVKAAAAATDVTATHESKGGRKFTVITYTAGNNAQIRGWINDDNLPERVATTIDNAVLGDISFEVEFADYRNFNGVNFPSHIVQKQAGYPVLDWRVAQVKANVPVTIQAGNPPSPAPLTTEKLDDGVYLIAGGYAAVAVDFEDHILIVEGGQGEQRSQAVINEVKRLIPGKPIKTLVNTHAHFDHLGGVRAYVAEGATIVTHQSNQSYYRKIWANPHTLKPDALSKTHRKPEFATVDDKLTLTDGDKVVELYHLKDFAHHDGTLIAYLPRQKLLIEADAFNPPPAPLTQSPAVASPYHLSLLANIEQRGLDVQRIIPIHLPADNRKVTLAELRVAVGK